MAFIKNRGRWGLAGALAVTALLLLVGCQPPGPRALLKGGELIRKGRYAEAIKQLQTATELLPQAAQAWNHLGLAYHGNGQPQEALRAYQKALAIDHKLATAHFNLGCLFLEQNNLPAAINELTAFTMIEPGSTEGWLKLGNAQLRTGRLDAAEKSLRAALEIEPRSPEAFNSLGVAKYQRRRPQEALECFNKALSLNSNCAPAVLNVAVLSHQTLNNRTAALEKYRHYLTLKPQPANWAAVEATAHQLESELTPASARPTLGDPAPVTTTRSTAPSTFQTAAQRTPTNRSTSAIASTASGARTTSPPATASASRPETGSPTPILRPVTVPQVTLSSPSPVLTKTAPSPLTPSPAITSKPPDIEVTYLSDEPSFKPPQDPSAPDAARASARGPDTQPSIQAPVSGQEGKSKRNLLDRINPFRSRVKVSRGPPALTPLPDGPTLAPEPGAGAVSESSEPGPADTAPLVIARYAYGSPGAVSSGDRPQATRLLTEGFQAQQAGKLSQALSEYRASAQADPSFFEAHYNHGLVAYELGRWKESLTAYEHALALQPDSADARYNFALALKRANYPLDAAEELKRLLRSRPDETRGHYSLANLYAQQLNQAALAKPHYLRVLDRDPKHPEAGKIRYWLAQHP